MTRFHVVLHSKNMRFLENDNKRADFPKISENFRKIREQAITREREEIPTIFFRGSDSFHHLLLQL